MREQIKIRQGQVWQAKGYADHNERTVIVREINGSVIWIELKDGQKVTTDRQSLTQNYQLINP